MTRVVGPPRSRRRRWLFLITTVATIAMSVLFIPSAFAVHDIVFQLDGEVSTLGYTTPSGAQVYDCGNNNAGNSSPPLTGTNGLFNVTDTPSPAPGTEAVTNNPALVGVGKPFDTAAFVRDFLSGSPCSSNSLSTTF